MIRVSLWDHRFSLTWIGLGVTLDALIMSSISTTALTLKNDGGIWRKFSYTFGPLLGRTGAADTMCLFITRAGN